VRSKVIIASLKPLFSSPSSYLAVPTNDQPTTEEPNLKIT
jgi:hypothetical protein